MALSHSFSPTKFEITFQSILKQFSFYSSPRITPKRDTIRYFDNLLKTSSDYHSFLYTLNNMLKNSIFPDSGIFFTMVEMLRKFNKANDIIVLYHFLIQLPTSHFLTNIFTKMIRELGHFHNEYYKTVYHFALSSKNCNYFTHTTILEQAVWLKDYNLAQEAYRNSKQLSVSAFACRYMLIACAKKNDYAAFKSVLLEEAMHLKDRGLINLFATASTEAKKNNWLDLQAIADKEYDKHSLPSEKSISSVEKLNPKADAFIPSKKSEEKSSITPKQACISPPTSPSASSLVSYTLFGTSGVTSLAPEFFQTPKKDFSFQ